MSYNDGEDDLSQNDDDENTKEVDTDVLFEFPDFDTAEPACQSAIFVPITITQVSRVQTSILHVLSPCSTSTL